MAIDMKKVIAKKTEELLKTDRSRELTVTDIAKACGIARQTFYYHFEDIPHLMDYIMTERGEQIRERIDKDHLSLRDVIRESLGMLSSTLPEGPESDKLSRYRMEMQQIILKHAKKTIEATDEAMQLFPGKTKEERDFLIRYHLMAIVGIVMNWTDQDAAHVDEIADLVVSQILEPTQQPEPKTEH